MTSDTLLSKKNIIIGVGVILVVLLLFSIFGGKSSDSNGNSSNASDQIYSIKSDSSEILGELLVKNHDAQSGSGNITYVFVINDNLDTNGKCIDAGEPFCSKDTSGNLASAESIKYRYALVIDGVVGADGGAVGTALEPVYCNQEKLIANPMSASLISNTGETLDISCGQGFSAANWSPTSMFVARNGSSVESLGVLLNSNSLRLYDTSNLYKTKYTTTANSGKAEQINPTLEESISNGILVKTYSISLEEN